MNPNSEISRGVSQNRGICEQAFPLLPSPLPYFIILEIINLHDFLSSNLLDIRFVGICLLFSRISVLLRIRRCNIVTEDHYQKLSYKSARPIGTGPAPWYILPKLRIRCLYTYLITYLELPGFLRFRKTIFSNLLGMIRV